MPVQRFPVVRTRVKRVSLLLLPPTWLGLAYGFWQRRRDLWRVRPQPGLAPWLTRHKTACGALLLALVLGGGVAEVLRTGGIAMGRWVATSPPTQTQHDVIVPRSVPTRPLEPGILYWQQPSHDMLVFIAGVVACAAIIIMGPLMVMHRFPEACVALSLALAMGGIMLFADDIIAFLR